MFGAHDGRWAAGGAKSSIFLTDNVHAHALAVDLQARHGDMDVYQSPSASSWVSRDVMSRSAWKSWAV